MKRIVVLCVLLLLLVGCGSSPEQPTNVATPRPSLTPITPPMVPKKTPTPSAPPVKTTKPMPSRTTTAPPAPKPTATTEEPEAAYYASCKAAKAAGVAPLHRGDPGYRSGLDRDGDGTACE